MTNSIWMQVYLAQTTNNQRRRTKSIMTIVNSWEAAMVMTEIATLTDLLSLKQIEGGEPINNVVRSSKGSPWKRSRHSKK